MFDKRPTTINEQIEILKSRGLKIESESEARHYLSQLLTAWGVLAYVELFI